MLLSCRAELLVLYEQVILTDIEFSDSQNVDQALWKNVFYQVIERFRQLLKDPSYDNTPHIRNMLLTLLDEVKHVWCDLAVTRKQLKSSQFRGVNLELKILQVHQDRR